MLFDESDGSPFSWVLLRVVCDKMCCTFSIFALLFTASTLSTSMALYSPVPVQDLYQRYSRYLDSIQELSGPLHPQQQALAA